MKNSEITMDEWKSLYEVSLKFKELACWEWMEDCDIFGVQNPADGEIGYCCILGGLGEVFALNVYLGTEGLDVQQRMLNGEFPPSDMELLFIQECLMASFENKKALKKKDLKIIEELGLKFRGKNAWPLFTSYLPGYIPWYLKKEEVNFLTLALEQAIFVAKRFKEDTDLLTPSKRGTYFVRVPEKKGETHVWKDEWLKPAPLKKEKEILPPVDEIRLRKIKKETKQGKNVWELDYSYSPMVINEGERPYYPFLYLCIDRNSQLVIGNDIAEKKDRVRFRETFLSMIEKIRFIPGTIIVKRKEVAELFEPVTKPLGIKIKLADSLNVLEQVQDMMTGFMM